MAQDEAGFDPGATALYLEDGGRAQPLPLDADFWRDLTEGRIAVDDGWLTMVLPMSGDTPHWEMHPHGEELLLVQSGSFVVVMEGDRGERRVRLDHKTPAFVMPRGTWHRFEVETPGRILFATYGRGTVHKPR